MIVDLPKPRITRFFGLWACIHGDSYGYGKTPLGAYAEWAVKFQKLHPPRTIFTTNSTFIAKVFLNTRMAP